MERGKDDSDFPFADVIVWCAHCDDARATLEAEVRMNNGELISPLPLCESCMAQLEREAGR